MSASLSRAGVAQATGVACDTAPVRIVHFGLGAFHRAHQAWFTSVVDAQGEWGIAAFTGRSPAAAELLAPQDGLFTLIERSGEGDVASIVHSLVEVWDGARIDRIVALLSAPTTAIVTLTVTESGYCVTSDGSLDWGNPLVAADVALLQEKSAHPANWMRGEAPRSVLARLVIGLEARQHSGGGAIAVVPCDNMPANGRIVEKAVIELAGHRSEELVEWVRENVSFVSTSVDRITPQTTDDDRRVAQSLTGWADRAPVVTEPFCDWVLEGNFPAGRPAWELAGATFVDDIEPFERRKLWMLNGAHTLLACAGQLRGFTTVAEAIADPELRRQVGDLWDEVERHLPASLALDAYRVALLARFDNERIEHRLAQIAVDSTLKVGVRIAPVARAERLAGRTGAACARVVASWIVAARSGALASDSSSQDIVRANELPRDESYRALVTLIDPELAADGPFVDLVTDLVASLSVLPLPHSPLQGELS